MNTTQKRLSAIIIIFIIMGVFCMPYTEGWYVIFKQKLSDPLTRFAFSEANKFAYQRILSRFVKDEFFCRKRWNIGILYLKLSKWSVFLEEFFNQTKLILYLKLMEWNVKTTDYVIFANMLLLGIVGFKINSYQTTVAICFKNQQYSINILNEELADAVKKMSVQKNIVNELCNMVANTKLELNKKKKDFKHTLDKIKEKQKTLENGFKTYVNCNEETIRGLSANIEHLKEENADTLIQHIATASDETIQIFNQITELKRDFENFYQNLPIDTSVTLYQPDTNVENVFFKNCLFATDSKLKLIIPMVFLNGKSANTIEQSNTHRTSKNQSTIVVADYCNNYNSLINLINIDIMFVISENNNTNIFWLERNKNAFDKLLKLRHITFRNNDFMLLHLLKFNEHAPIETIVFIGNYIEMPIITDFSTITLTRSQRLKKGGSNIKFKDFITYLKSFNHLKNIMFFNTEHHLVTVPTQPNQILQNFSDFLKEELKINIDIFYDTPPSFYD